MKFKYILILTIFFSSNLLSITRKQLQATGIGTLIQVANASANTFNNNTRPSYELADYSYTQAAIDTFKVVGIICIAGIAYNKITRLNVTKKTLQT